MFYSPKPLTRKVDAITVRCLAPEMTYGSPRQLGGNPFIETPRWNSANTLVARLGVIDITFTP